jgi:hypothetical protein
MGFLVVEVNGQDKRSRAAALRTAQRFVPG